MKKTPTIFKRNQRNMALVTTEINPDCQWVLDGEGVATQKYDGTCCLVENGKLWKRREVKKGKPVPADFWEMDYDAVTGKQVGWVPVTDSADDKWHREGEALNHGGFKDGTYELCGPKIQGNPEGFENHVFIRHDTAKQHPEAPRTYEGLRDYLQDQDIEGLVFHHPDGRMAKIKKRDFGFKR